MLVLGELPRPDEIASHWWLHKGLSYAVFLGAMLPLLVGGKVYNSIRVVMGIKIVVVFGFLILLGLLYSQWSTWWEIFSGFFRLGTVPISGTAEPGQWAAVDNLFVALWQGRPLPQVDLSMIATLAAFAAIAGQGGLTNTPISNYTRDQGWGMGWQVGAIPSMIGSRNLKLSHVGSIFRVDDQSLPRWRRWYRHVLRDQLVVWMPACFLGVALPSMLSIQFLEPGVETTDWAAAGMTADGVRQHATSVSGAFWGQAFWFGTVLCGFLVLGPSMCTTADGLVRRWVDVFWTSNARLRRVDPKNIRYLYFGVLSSWAAFGMMMLMLNPTQLIHAATLLANFALGSVASHASAVNLGCCPRRCGPTGLFASAWCLPELSF